MKKLFCLWLFATVAFLAYAQQGQKELVDKVVARVGGELVLLSDVQEQYSYMKDNKSGELPPDARCGIMEGLLLNGLLLNQSKLDSIKVTDEEVESQMAARLDQILRMMNNDNAQFEAYYGQSVGEVKEQMREDLKNKLLIDRMRAKITEDFKVTPSEVTAFFSKIPRDSLPYFNSEVELSEILYKPKLNEVQKKIAYDKLNDIRKRIIDKTATFEELAMKFSDDPGSGRAGGDLGWAKRGTFVGPFEATAYKLEINEVSEVIESEFGYHIIQLLERRGNTIHARHILIKPHIVEEDIVLAKAQLDSIRTLLTKDSITFSLAVKKYSDKKTQSYNNDGRMTNPNTGNTIFDVRDLDPEIYFALEKMKVKDVSQALRFEDPSGDIYFRLILLVSKTDPHRANLHQDYSKIQQATLDAKKNEFTQNWMKQKVGSTYITMDEDLAAECKGLAKWNKKKKSK